MKSARYVLAMCLLAFAVQARADILDDIDNEVVAIYNDVVAIYNEVTGEVTDTAHDLERQLTLLRQSLMITDSVNDLLTWFEYRRGPLVTFVSGGPGRCGAGSPCAQFREDLDDFILDIADLKSRYPQVEQYGLGDGAVLTDITDNLPPFVLFGIYEIFQRFPNWQDIPADLAAIYDEIGDPDAFSLTLPDTTATSAASMASARAAAVLRSSISNQATQAIDKFCAAGKQPKFDEVRLNQLTAFFFLLKDGFDAASEYPSDTAEVSLLGEGVGNLKVPTKALLKSISDLIDAILNFVATYRANLAVCGQIEADVAQCAPLVKYQTLQGNNNAYFVVSGAIAASQTAGINTRAANLALSAAATLRTQGQLASAYPKICCAYSSLWPRSGALPSFCSSP